MNKELNDFIKARDYILANIENLTIEEIKEHCQKFHIPIPTNEKSIIGGLHKARLNVTKLNGISNKEFLELKNKSKAWLDNEGWRCEII